MAWVAKKGWDLDGCFAVWGAYDGLLVSIAAGMGEFAINLGGQGVHGDVAQSWREVEPTLR